MLQGGLPRGRFVVIVGDYSTLKSYIGYRAIANCQAMGGTAALIDNERSYDPEWARECGIDTDRLILYPPKDADPSEFFPGELAVDVAEALTRDKIDLIVFDSIAATLPQAEQNKRMWDENIQPARLAALMSAAGRRLTAANSQTAFLWINQFRMNVGMTFGDPNVMTGGRAMPYYASHIIVAKKVGKVTKDAKVWDGEKWKTTKEQVVQKYQLTVTKSKLSKPFRDVYFDWDLISGAVDNAGYLIAQGLENGTIKVKGKTWTLNGHRAVGRQAFKTMLLKHPELLNQLEDATRKEHNLQAIKRSVPKKRLTRRK